MVTLGNLECSNIHTDHGEKQLLCRGFTWLIDKIKQIWLFMIFNKKPWISSVHILFSCFALFSVYSFASILSDVVLYCWLLLVPNFCNSSSTKQRNIGRIQAKISFKTIFLIQESAKRISRHLKDSKNLSKCGFLVITLPFDT